MNANTPSRLFLLALVSLAAWLLIETAPADEGSLPEIGGLFGMQSAGDAAWLAVRIDVPEGQALSGITWFNNDGEVVFSEILVGTGYESSPGDLSDFIVVAGNVQGESSAWSEVVFDTPVVASLSALYVVFSFPPEQILAAAGAGGGPGIGYVTDGSGQRGWLSGGDEAWARLHDDYGFAAIPQFVTATPGMVVKSLGSAGDDIPPVEPYLSAGPNPFNPTIAISFGLDRRLATRLDVFDVRGRRVIRLVDQMLGPGNHQVTWQGRDEVGRGVASGVYVLRLTAEDLEFKQRVTLVR